MSEAPQSRTSHPCGRFWSTCWFPLFWGSRYSPRGLWPPGPRNAHRIYHTGVHSLPHGKSFPSTIRPPSVSPGPTLVNPATVTSVLAEGVGVRGEQLHPRNRFWATLQRYLCGALCFPQSLWKDRTSINPEQKLHFCLQQGELGSKIWCILPPFFFFLFIKVTWLHP